MSQCWALIDGLGSNCLRDANQDHLKSRNLRQLCWGWAANRNFQTTLFKTQFLAMWFWIHFYHASYIWAACLCTYLRFQNLWWWPCLVAPRQSEPKRLIQVINEDPNLAKSDPTGSSCLDFPFKETSESGTKETRVARWFGWPVLSPPYYTLMAGTTWGPGFLVIAQARYTIGWVWVQKLFRTHT